MIILCVYSGYKTYAINFFDACGDLGTWWKPSEGLMVLHLGKTPSGLGSNMFN